MTAFNFDIAYSTTVMHHIFDSVRSAVKLFDGIYKYFTGIVSSSPAQQHSH